MSGDHQEYPPLARRSTADLVAIILAATVAVVVLATVAFTLIWRVQHPDADMTDVATRVGHLVGPLVGAVVGYLAGIGAQSRARGSGRHRSQPEAERKGTSDEQS